MIAALFIAFVALQIADAVTTWAILEAGGKELNPIVRWMMAKMGVHLGLVVKTIVAVGVIGLLLPKLPWEVLAILDIFYVGILINNVNVLRKKGS